MRSYSLPTVALLGTLLVPVAVSANDSSFGGEGSDLAPLRETRIRMKSEDIVLEMKDELWQVEARYVFDNPTDEAVELQVGFPERHCEDGDDCSGDVGGRFIGLRTEVNGRRVRTRVGRVGDRPSWAPRVGRAFLFDVRFEAGEETEIVHRYRMHRSRSVEARDEVFYVTRTGALWNGSIGHARFTVRLPYRPWRVAYPSSYELDAYAEAHADDGRAITSIVFDMHDWTPRADLQVYLGWPSNALGGLRLDCPDPGRLERDLGTEVGTPAELAPFFEDVATSDLRVCRNLVFAAHGYPFRTPSLRSRFYAPASAAPAPHGYLTVEEAREREMPVDAYRVFYFRENPTYSQALLTPEERRYVQRVNAVLQSR